MNKKDWRHTPHYIDLLEVGKILDGKSIAVLNSNQISLPQTHHKGQLAEWAGNIFTQQGGKAECPILGTVILNKRSGKTTLAHGNYNKIRLIALLSVKNVIEKGALLAEDFSLPNESSHWKCAPVLIDNVVHIVTVLIHNDSNGQRMYLHSVIQKQQLALGVSGANRNTGLQQQVGSLMPVFDLTLPQASVKVNKTSRKHPNSLTSADIKQILQTALCLCQDH